MGAPTPTPSPSAPPEICPCPQTRHSVIYSVAYLPFADNYTKSPHSLHRDIPSHAPAATPLCTVLQWWSERWIIPHFGGGWRRRARGDRPSIDGQATDTKRAANGLLTDGLRAIHGRATDFTRAIHGRDHGLKTDETRTRNGRTTIRVESWKLDSRLLEAAGGQNRHASVIP